MAHVAILLTYFLTYLRCRKLRHLSAPAPHREWLQVSQPLSEPRRAARPAARRVPEEKERERKREKERERGGGREREGRLLSSAPCSLPWPISYF